jgi:hypothetical protein
MSLNLGPATIFGGAEASSVTSPVLTIAVVGASNAARLVAILDEAGVQAHHVEVPSWRQNPAVIEEAVTALNNITFQDPSLSMIVVFNLDNAAYYALTEEGDLIPSRRLDGHYHIDGSLVTAPKEQFKFNKIFFLGFY